VTRVPHTGFSAPRGGHFSDLETDWGSLATLVALGLTISAALRRSMLGPSLANRRAWPQYIPRLLYADCSTAIERFLALFVRRVVLVLNLVSICLTEAARFSLASNSTSTINGLTLLYVFFDRVGAS